jgi:hypothetical protein
MSLLFIPKVIHEHGEPWWNDDNSHLVAKQKEWAKGMRICSCRVFLFILASDFIHTVMSYNMGPWPYFPSKGRCAVDFYHP